MAVIRVLLADDHTILRQGVRALLDVYPDVEVVGEAADGQEAVELTRRLQPDLVLLDISMPRMNGLVAAGQIHEELPAVKIIVLTQHGNPEYVMPFLDVGATGYVLKQAADTDLIRAIRSVHNGDSYLDPPIAKVVLDAYNADSTTDAYETLTPREREVLILVAEGRTNREIAEVLHVSHKTVDVHRSHMMEKLGLHNVAEVTRYAIHRSLLDSE